MRGGAIVAATFLVSAELLYGIPQGHAADLVWEVENPYRFFRRPASFEAQERAFDAAGGAIHGEPVAEDMLPKNILWRVERRLNDPDCKNRSTPDSCLNTAGPQYEQRRLGWAAQTLDFTCYERDARPRRYFTTCVRQYSWGTAREDYILPDAHTVDIHIAPEQLASAGEGDCVWTWQPRRPDAPVETRKQPCKFSLVIKRVPFSLDRGLSGVSVKVQLPNGSLLAEPDVVVDDLLVVALGDSFASGESNPDRPVTFSDTRQMLYDPVNVNRDNMANRSPTKKELGYGLASADDFNPKSLPKRLMEDEEKGLIYSPTSPEFLAAFDKARARWLSADCHRSQYGYPFRVSMGLALEDRHRAITFVSLACSGADIAEGLFGPADARDELAGPEGQKTVPPQLDALSALICRSEADRTDGMTYRLPVYASGSTRIGEKSFTMRWCAPQSRKRPIDVLLLSIGGNDVGFGSLVTYAITDTASDIAPIAGLLGHELRFSPSVSEVYLSVLDRRMQALKQALSDGFGVDPSRVLQNAYEPIQFDETGNVCGNEPTLGLDVYPKFRYDRTRTQEVSNFVHELQIREACMTNAAPSGCPAGLATGRGTGFHFITDHTVEFFHRGVCARDPRGTASDQINMSMPRVSNATGSFTPYSPAGALPYGHRWRLVRDPNDAFLAANTHREGISPFDDLQPPYVALVSGAFHPTAEGHAIVADHVLRHVNELLEKRKLAQLVKNPN
jgi:lysophospholipase L1-like esterase